MPNPSEGQSGAPSAWIMVVAVAQFVVSLALLAPSGIFLFEELQLLHLYPSTYRPLPPAVSLFYIILPIGFAVLGVITSIGLWLLREWARKCTLFLAFVPAAVYGVALILGPRSVFPDIYVDVVAGSVFLGIPVSIWWLILFTRPGMKAQFQSR